jgi:hypothetical protein
LAEAANFSVRLSGNLSISFRKKLTIRSNVFPCFKWFLLFISYKYNNLYALFGIAFFIMRIAVVEDKISLSEILSQKNKVRIREPYFLFSCGITKYPFGISSHHTVCVADSSRSTDLRLPLSEVIAISGILGLHGGE